MISTKNRGLYPLSPSMRSAAGLGYAKRLERLHLRVEPL